MAIIGHVSNQETSIKGSVMKSIDFKSLLVGVLGNALVMVLMFHLP
mgnify:CR=1 FL=1